MLNACDALSPTHLIEASVWMHTLDPTTTKTIRQIQKLGGQAITGASSSVAGVVAEAEAYISQVKERR